MKPFEKSLNELEQRNRRRERNKLAQQKVRKKMNEQTGELRRQAVNLEIENANLFSWIYILSLFYEIFFE